MPNNCLYTQLFNRINARVGHVFQGRKSILVEKQFHLLELCRYIFLNPVDTGIIAHPSEYSWHSYRYTSQSIKEPEYLYSNWLLSQLDREKRKTFSIQQ